MKTNVSIKFNSIEEYREIERVLKVLGFERYIVDLTADKGYVLVNKKHIKYSVVKFLFNKENTYNSLQEFLKDNKN